MPDPSVIFRYFPELSKKQKEQFTDLQILYSEWNEKINVISRKDIEHLYERHVLHSLAISKIIQFNEGAEVMDLGTGGGFPGIPLAIFFPKTLFTLVDSIGKKIKVVNEISNSLQLNNVITLNDRTENVNRQFDFIVSRATSTLDDLVKWTNRKYKKENKHNLQNGLICLKGGDLSVELKSYRTRMKLIDITTIFNEKFFESKKIVYLPL